MGDEKLSREELIDRIRWALPAFWEIYLSQKDDTYFVVDHETVRLVAHGIENLEKVLADLSAGTDLTIVRKERRYNQKLWMRS
jgi:hypothetical protein